MELDNQIQNCFAFKVIPECCIILCKDEATSATMPAGLVWESSQRNRARSFQMSLTPLVEVPANINRKEQRWSSPWASG